MQFSDPNEDCLLLIFEFFDINYLISLANTKEYTGLVEGVIRRKLAKKTVIIRDVVHPRPTSNLITENDDSIESFDNATILMILKRFGHLILSLNEDNDLKTQTAKPIHEYINLYCSETLTHLDIHNRYNDIFNEYKKPFRKLVSLKLGGIFKRFDPKEKTYLELNFNFNETFPSVRRLNLARSSVYDMMDEQIVPQLEELTIFCFDDYERPYIIKFLRNHLQIKSLSIEHVRPKFLQFIANMAANELLNLEKFTLKNYNNRNDNDNTGVHFERVKSFTVDEIYSSSMPSHITLCLKEAIHFTIGIILMRKNADIIFNHKY